MSSPAISAQFPTVKSEVSPGVKSVTALAPPATVAVRALWALSWMTALLPRKNPSPVPPSVMVAPSPTTSNCLMPTANARPAPARTTAVLPGGMYSSIMPLFVCCQFNAQVLNATNAALSSATPLHVQPKSVTMFFTTAESMTDNVAALLQEL